MTRLKSFVQALIGVGLLLGLTILLIGLFASANKPQSGSRVQQTGVPTAEATAIFTPEPPQVQPTLTPVAAPALGPRPAGILYESAGELYWQPVDEQGKATAAVARVPIDRTAEEKITGLYPSPDGKQVIFLKTNSSTESEIMYVFAPPDGQQHPLLGGVGLGLGTKIFGWHPNSQQVIYWDGEKVWLRDVYSDEPTLAADPQKWANLPYAPLVDGVAFSPDGQQLIVSYTPTGQSGEVWTVNADGSEPKLLFKEDYYRMAGFAWSPDGKSIAFVGRDVEVISSDGQNRRTVGSGFTGGAFPAWSPDSRYIAFTAWEPSAQGDDGHHTIRIVDVASGTERNLLDDAPKGGVLPVWSPDGSSVLFLSEWSDARGAAEVWAASLDGTHLQQLTFDGQPKRAAPAWLPTLGSD